MNQRFFTLLTISFILLSLAPKVFAECEFPGPPPPPLLADEYAKWQEKQNQYEKCSQKEFSKEEPQSQPTESKMQKTESPKPNPPQSTATSTPQGNVINVTSSKPDVKSFTAGVDFKAGDTIKTDENTKVYIILPDNGSLMVDTNSTFIYSPADKKSWAEVLKGGVRFSLIKAFDRNWRITTNSIVAAVRGTDFLIEKGENDQTTLRVLSGKVAASDPKGENTVEVPEGYQTTTSKDHPPSSPTKFDPAKLNKWYQVMDEKLKKQTNPAPVILAALILVIAGVSYAVIKFKRSS